MIEEIMTMYDLETIHFINCLKGKEQSLIPLNEGIKTMLSTPHELLFPALFISATVLAFNLLGDGLRDALDARLRSSE